MPEMPTNFKNFPEYIYRKYCMGLRTYIKKDIHKKDTLQPDTLPIYLSTIFQDWIPFQPRYRQTSAQINNIPITLPHHVLVPYLNLQHLLPYTTAFKYLLNLELDDNVFQLPYNIQSRIIPAGYLFHHNYTIS